MSRLLDPKDRTGRFPFEYRPSHQTDVRKTWEKFKTQPTAKVCPMKRKESK